MWNARRQSGYVWSLHTYIKIEGPADQNNVSRMCEHKLIKTKLMYQRIHVRDLSWYRFDMSCLYLIPSLSMMVFSNEWLNGRYMEQTYDLWNLWVYMSVRWEVMNNNLRLYIQLLFVGIDEHRSIKGSWKRVVCLHPPDSMQMMCDCREGPLCMHVRDIFKRK